jgi:hypothetical protein
MPNLQVSRLAQRQDQVLQIPFPTPPPLAKQINQGVLKQQGAGQYDQQMKRWIEQVQNVLRLSLRFPQLEQWQTQLESLTTLEGSVASAIASLSQLQLTVSQMSSDISGNSLDIGTLQVQVAGLISAVNLFNQYVHTELSPVNPWTINYNRSVRPCSLRIFTTPDYREVEMFQTDDSTIGTTIATFGYNLGPGIAILGFS